MTSIKNLQVEEVEMSTAINAASLVSNVTAKLNGSMVTLEVGIYSSEDFISDGSKNTDKTKENEAVKESIKLKPVLPNIEASVFCYIFLYRNILSQFPGKPIFFNSCSFEICGHFFNVSFIK